MGRTRLPSLGQRVAVLPRAARKLRLQRFATHGQAPQGSSTTSTKPLEVKVVQVSTQPGWQTPAIVASLGLVAAGAVYWAKETSEERAAAALRQQELAREAAAKKAAAAAAAAAEQEKLRVERLLREEEEAQAAAAAAAAAAAKRAEMLDGLKSAVEAAAAPKFSAQALQQLKTAVAAVEAARGQEEAQDEAVVSSELFLTAYRRLKELNKIQEAFLKHEAACYAMEVALDDEDAETLRSSVANAEAAAQVLVEAGQDVPEHVGLLEDARRSLQEYDAMIQQAKERLAAHEALEAVVAQRPISPSACQEALDRARDLGLGPSVPAVLAQLLTAQQDGGTLWHEMPGSLARQQSAATPLLCGAAELDQRAAREAMTVEDFVSAEEATLGEMDEAQLRARLRGLARTLVSHHALRVRELQVALDDTMPRFTELCATRSAEAKRILETGKEEETRLEAEALTEIIHLQGQQLADEAAAQVRHEASLLAAAVSDQETQRSLGETREVQQDLQAKLTLAETTIAALEELHAARRSPQDQVRRNQGFVSGLMAVSEDTARLNLKKLLEQADSFADAVLRRLPAATLPASESSLPSSQDLRISLECQIPSLVAAAFQPAGQSGWLLGDLASRLCGRFFAFFYVLGSEAAGTLERHALQVEEQQVLANREQNLSALAQAMELLRRSEVAAALLTLEGRLTGPCREAAKTWMHEARQALQLQQALRAALARARCLNSVVHM